jgi:hypothetical protein
MKAVWILIGILALSFVALIVLISKNYNEDVVNKGYAKPFEAQLRQKRVSDDDSDEPPSREVHGPGLREADIQKHHGRNFSTY